MYLDSRPFYFGVGHLKCTYTHSLLVSHTHVHARMCTSYVHICVSIRVHRHTFGIRSSHTVPSHPTTLGVRRVTIGTP